MFIPILNADAHENASDVGRPHQRGPHSKGARTNAQGLDLKRDYAQLQWPEIAAVIKLLREFDPALYIDVHVSDGTDYQYDVTYTFAGWGTYARFQATAGWLMSTYTSEVDAALSAQGHVPAAYPSWVDQNAPRKELTLPAGALRIAAGQPLRLLAAALLEPESDDSFLANGWFDQVLPAESPLARHLLAPMADTLFASNGPLLHGRCNVAAKIQLLMLMGE